MSFRITLYDPMELAGRAALFMVTRAVSALARAFGAAFSKVKMILETSFWFSLTAVEFRPAVPYLCKEPRPGV